MLIQNKPIWTPDNSNLLRYKELCEIGTYIIGEDLKTQLAYYAAGEEVPVTIQRQNGSEYEEQKVTITLGKLSDYQDSQQETN